MGALFLFTGCKSKQAVAVAHVGGSVITLSDLSSRLQDAPPAYQQYAASPEGRRQFLNLLVREKVLLEESRKAGMQQNEDYKKAVSRFKQKWERDLKDYEESLLIEMYLARLRSKDLTVTDADVRRYYDDHAADYARPVEIQASHILVNSSDDAERALARLKSGESFEAVAKKVSLDPPTAAQGGKLKPFTKGSLLPEFENAAFQLKDGQISDVVKSPFGYHIIKKTGHRTLPSRSFESAKDEIRNRMQREKFDQWVSRAQTSLGVNIDEKALAAVSLSQAGAPPIEGGVVQ